MFKREGTFLSNYLLFRSKSGKSDQVSHRHYDQHVTLPIAAGKINRVD